MDNINADRGSRERENRVQQNTQEVTESNIGVSSDNKSKASRSTSSYRGGASSSSRLNIRVGNMGPQDSAEASSSRGDHGPGDSPDTRSNGKGKLGKVMHKIRNHFGKLRTKTSGTNHRSESEPNIPSKAGVSNFREYSQSAPDISSRENASKPESRLEKIKLKLSKLSNSIEFKFPTRGKKETPSPGNKMMYGTQEKLNSASSYAHQELDDSCDSEFDSYDSEFDSYDSELDSYDSEFDDSDFDNSSVSIYENCRTDTSSPIYDTPPETPPLPNTGRTPSPIYDTPPLQNTGRTPSPIYDTPPLQNTGRTPSPIYDTPPLQKIDAATNQVRGNRHLASNGERIYAEIEPTGNEQEHSTVGMEATNTVVGESPRSMHDAPPLLPERNKVGGQAEADAALLTKKKRRGFLRFKK
ncbi:hypothetical protein Ark11_1497 [Candidatus Ichthyocystis hellenicum]|uniref:Uncharacterized protein n=1 Tax=Candidatus Ichthyocystis hellenicum TaxID=1561003 RepID=A0A0S4M3F2_9BURK|nr:hypothetical protein [Candidatus Ichthyocystis hellenicum]CUT18295.1 hypothetical protein Ark11_1497 [Candidatus Ichthyocystis hellenicum]